MQDGDFTTAGRLLFFVWDHIAGLFDLEWLDLCLDNVTRWVAFGDLPSL